MRFLSQLFRRKNRVIRVSNVSFPADPLIVETSLQQLRQLGSTIFESDVDWFCIKGGTVYRRLKDKPRPDLLPVQDVKLHPDLVGTIVTVDLPYLSLLACRNNALILETEDEYLLPTPMGLFRSPKEVK